MRQLGAFAAPPVVQAGSFASLTQAGTRNEARIEQMGRATARLSQSGTDNLLAGFDGPSGLTGALLAAVQADASTLLLSQIGTGNQAFVHQDSGAYAQVTQDGTGNTVRLLQSGGFY